MRVHGFDFTSAPRPEKPIVMASGHASGEVVLLQELAVLQDWGAFESALTQAGPWLAGFDFPFGLPREAVEDLNWPTSWREMVLHCESLGRTAFKDTLDTYRQSRPAGARYAHRTTDLPARSHSPLKLVNPPVGLMFLEGAPRLIRAGLHVPGLSVGDPERIAIEAYPGLLARTITRESYKSDARAKQTPKRRAAREEIASALLSGRSVTGIRLETTSHLHERMVCDASGDCLDAVLALVQAASAVQSGPPWYGLNPLLDPLEGWIATVPATESRF